MQVNRILAGVMFLATASAMAQTAPVRHKVAVLDFGYASVMDVSQAVFGTQTNIGKGISDLLVDKLTNDGTYRVIERNAISKVMSEQNFSNSDRVDASSAAKIGKILGVDAIITGDITQFGRDDQSKNYGALAGGFAGGALGRLGTTKSKAVVAVTARLIDANTGEVLASTQAKGESTRSSNNLLAGGAGTGGGAVGGMGMGSSNFAQTIIGEATANAINQLAQGLEAAGDKFAVAAPVPVAGMVADVAGADVIINVGAEAGVRVGDTLTVSHPVRQVKDPATGKVLRTVENTVGQLKITSVDASSASGTFTGATPAKVGDSVKTPAK